MNEVWRFINNENTADEISIVDDEADGEDAVEQNEDGASA
jgi:hypothetical protein